MTIAVFLGALLGAMALGIPIAYALLASGVALMWHLDMFDAQILAQNLVEGTPIFGRKLGKNDRKRAAIDAF